MSTTNAKVVEVLKSMDEEAVLDIARQLNSWDGCFQDTELDNYSFEDIIELFAYDTESVRRLLVMIANDKPDLNANYFWFDAYGIHSSDEIDVAYYLDKIAKKLIDEAGFAGFPDYGITDELAEAIAEASGLEVEEL